MAYADIMAKVRPCPNPGKVPFSVAMPVHQKGWGWTEVSPLFPIIPNLMPHPQSCHLEEGGENGEAEEEVEVSFEVGGIRRCWRKGMRAPDFSDPHSFSMCSGPGLGLGDIGDTAVTKSVHWGGRCTNRTVTAECSQW